MSPTQLGAHLRVCPNILCCVKNYIYIQYTMLREGCISGAAKAVKGIDGIFIVKSTLHTLNSGLS